MPGNFIPFSGRAGPPPPGLPTHADPLSDLSGNGPPDGAVPANPGTKYTDLLTLNQFVKMNSSGVWGWQLVGTSCPCASGGGGVAVKQIYIGRAPSPPDNPQLPALNYPAGGGSLAQWDVASQQWL